MKLFLQKKCKVFERWGLRPQTPKTAPHCEFLTTRLLMSDGKKVWSSLLKVLRTFTYRSSVTVTAAPDSSMKIALMMPLAEIAAHTVHLRECRELGECNGRVQATNPLHSPKCTVWAAISARGIIRPIFIEESGAAVTVTKERYVEVLKTFKSELQTFFPSLMSKFWFKQDGASFHTSNPSRDWLKENFGGRVISLKTDLEWASYSPDLIPPDFFFGAISRTECTQGNPEPSLNSRKPSGRR